MTLRLKTVCNKRVLSTVAPSHASPILSLFGTIGGAIEYIGRPPEEGEKYWSRITRKGHALYCDIYKEIPKTHVGLTSCMLALMVKPHNASYQNLTAPCSRRFQRLLEPGRGS